MPMNTMLRKTERWGLFPVGGPTSNWLLMNSGNLSTGATITNCLRCSASQLDIRHTSSTRKDSPPRVCLEGIGNFSGGRGDHLPRQSYGRDRSRSKSDREDADLH